MKIRNVRHKGLRRYLETGSSSGLPANAVQKINDMLSFLQDMADEKELFAVPSWKAHQLTGDRRGTWALHVTKNWRLTFAIDKQEVEIIDLNYEDYH